MANIDEIQNNLNKIVQIEYYDNRTKQTLYATYICVPIKVYEKLDYFEAKLYIFKRPDESFSQITPSGKFSLNKNYFIKVTPVPNNLLKEYIHTVKKFKMNKHE